MLFTPIKPMLLHMGKELIDNEKWLYDIKWDGWRVILHKKGNKIEAYTRNGNIITSRFPELQVAAKSINVDTAIIDCEGVVLRNGISVFEDFTHRAKLTKLNKIEESLELYPATFIAFDVLMTSENQINKSLLKRREILQSIITPSKELVITPSILGEGKRLFNLTKNRGMEGIVAKRIDSTYQINKRSYDWLKYKHFKITDAIILGFKESPFALIVGIRLKNGKDRPIANVEFGFKTEEKIAFRKIAKDLVIKNINETYWIEPVLCCSIQYLEKTESNKLRIVSFKEFKLDKSPEDCTSIQNEVIKS